MPLHPQAATLLKQMQESGMPELHELPPDQARQQAAMLNHLVGAGPQVARVENIKIPTSNGEIGARRYAPDDAPAVIMWIHGGGFVICDLESHDAMCRILAVESGCEVISVDYRLAPEHPYPAAVEDCWDALTWVAEQAGGRPVILGGDSAGGNLTAVCTQRARDRGGPELAMQILVYPATSPDQTTESHQLYGEGDETFLTRADMEWFWSHYVGDREVGEDPELWPATSDLSGLPPAILVTAEYDPLRDDGFAYAEALKAAGVPVTHHHYDDMIHAFFSLVNILERGNEAVAQVGGDVKAAVAGSTAAA
jgi:acetyl esterase